MIVTVKNCFVRQLSSQLEEMIQQNRELRRRVKHNKYQISHWSETIVHPNSDSNSCDQINAQRGLSLAEMRNILLERNYLKKRLNELEEEVNQFKSLANNSADNLNNLMNETSVEPNWDELPVEGPINREPEDKLFPEKLPNRILRLYENIVSYLLFHKISNILNTLFVLFLSFPSISWPRVKRL